MGWEYTYCILHLPCFPVWFVTLTIPYDDYVIYMSTYVTLLSEDLSMLNYNSIASLSFNWEAGAYDDALL